MPGTRAARLYLANLLGLIILLIVGWLIWIGLAESLIVAGTAIFVGVAVSCIAPGAGIAGVLVASPTMYHLHAMPRGEFSLLELGTLVFVAGVGLRIIWSLLHLDVDALLAVFEPAHIIVPIALIVIATGIALVTMMDPAHRDASLRDVRMVILEPLLFFAAARIVMRRAETRTFAGYAFIGAGFVVALIALWQVTFTEGGVVAGDVIRATGPYSHPNNLSFFLERTMVFTVALVIVRPRWLWVWVVAVIQLVALGGTFSRGAVLAAACGVLVLLFIRRNYRWILGLGAIGLGFVAGALVIFSDRLIDAGGSGSEPTRFTIWQASLRMAMDHPIFGVGPDQFLYQYWRRYVEPMGWPERYTSHPHNIVLDVWLRFGFAGLAAFGTLVIGVVWWIRDHLAKVRGDPWALGAVGALAGGLTHGLVDNGFFLPDLATITWFFIAMVITLPVADLSNGEI